MEYQAIPVIQSIVLPGCSQEEDWEQLSGSSLLELALVDAAVDRVVDDLM